MTKKLFLLFICCFVKSALFLNAANFQVWNSGTEDIVDYSKYGKFEGIDTDTYSYKITDNKGLEKAVGEGIFPNTIVFQDPGYIEYKQKGLLEGSHWKFTNNDDHQANFYKWATTKEEPGVKLFNIAGVLEKSGNIKHAIKAYYAILINFPRSFGITYWNTPWYIAPVAINKITFLTKEHPELGMRLIDAYVKVRPSPENSSKNIFIINPGKIIKVDSNYVEQPVVDLTKLNIVKSIGKGEVKLIEYSNRHWQLLVNNKPYVVRGMSYSPNKIGLTPDNGTLNVTRDWMFADFNKNGKIDGPFESWVDKNYNNKQDEDEKPVGDFQLMKDMGVNTLRIYHHSDINKKLLKEGYKKYGFMYMMGDFFGMYATGSKAEWYYGTDYTNPEHRKNMLESVTAMVKEYKNEPYILMWVLGNETNYGEPGEAGISLGAGCRASLQPEAYYKFLNEAAKLIKSLDPKKRPVAVSNGDILFLDKFVAYAPEVDIFGVNAYRGEQGFGALWQDVSDIAERPVVLTEFGCCAYNPSWDQKRCEAGQAKYHKGNWLDIEDNLAGHGTGNALGGVVFEWLDEWWKTNADLPLKMQEKNKEWYEKVRNEYSELSPAKHDIVPQFNAPFLDGWSYEEWLGISSQGDGSDSPFMRQLRPVYFEYKKLWNKYKQQ